MRKARRGGGALDEENPIKANERKAKSISGSIERECQVFMMALLQSNAIITNTIKERAYWELPEKRRYFSIHFDTLGYVTIQFNTFRYTLIHLGGMPRCTFASRFP